MMTESEPGYTHQIQETKDRGKHLLWKISMFLILALFFQNEIAAEEKLRTGEWKGAFITYDGMLYKIKYIVSYGDETKKAPVKIKMINLDLEPLSEFTYNLSDIKISDKQLQFKIPMEYETKECTLDKENGSYSGTCRSTTGTTKETSKINMVPSAEEPPETE
jgi:hypothetical protein